MTRHARPRLLWAVALIALQFSTQASRAAQLARDQKTEPQAAVTRLGTTRFRHPQPLTSVAFTPDGKTLISADYHSTVRFWQVPTGLLLRELPGRPGHVLAIAPNGKLLVTVGQASNHIQLWDIATARPVRTLENPRGLLRPAFSPDGKTLLGALQQSACLWDVETGKKTATLTGHKHQVYAVAFSPDGKTIATGDGVNYAPRDFGKPPGCTIILWDAKTLKERRRFPAHHGWIYALAFSRDSQFLASASPYDSCLWKAASGEKLATLKGYYTVAFSPRANMLATGGEVTLWDAQTREKLRTVSEQVSYQTGPLAFSADGKTLATGNKDGLVRLWDVATGKELGEQRGHQGLVRAVAFSPDGAFVASTSGADGTLRLWGTASGAQLRKVTLRAGQGGHFKDAEAKSVQFAPDGKTLALATNTGKVKIFDVVTGGPVRELAHDGSFINAVAYSPDGKNLASSDWHESAFRVWEAATGKLLHTLQPYGDGGRHNSEVHAVAFSPDGKLLATGCSHRNSGDKNLEATILLWDVASGKQVRKFRPAGYPVIHLAFTPDGKALVSSASTWQKAEVQVWAVATGRLLREFSAEGGRGNWRESAPIALTPNGRLLATTAADNTIVLWEMLTGKEVRRFKGHKGPVTALAFGPDGQTLVSGSQDTTLLLWRLAVPPAEKAAPPQAPDAKQLQECWDALGDQDAAKAYRAVWDLTRGRDAAVALLKARLQPAGARDPGQIPRLITDLGSDRAEARAAATEKLRLFGAPAEPALYAALRRKLTLAVRQRVERVLETIAEHPIALEELQRLRALHVLESVGTPAAAALLQTLAKGHPTAPQSWEANAAAQRLTRRRALAALRVLTDLDLVMARRSLPGSRPERAVTDQGGAVTAVVFAADGKTVVTASTEGGVRLRAADTGKVLRRFPEARGGVEGAALTADGKRLAAACGDGRVLLWETATGRLLRALPGHGKAALCVAFTPDGRKLVSGGADGSVRVWDLATGAEVRRIATPVPKVTAIAVTRDGKRILSGGLVRVQDVFAGGAVRFTQPAPVHIWELATGKLVRKLPTRGSALALSPDGKSLIAGGLFCLTARNHKGWAFITTGEESIFTATQLRWYDLERAWEGRLVQGRGGAVVFAADGQTLLTVGGYDGHHETFEWGTNLLGGRGDPGAGVRLLETATGAEVLTGPAQEATAAALSPDGSILVWGRRDGTVVFWDIAPEDALAPYAGKLTASDLKSLWKDLGDERPARAHQALWALTAAGESAVACLRRHLQPVAPLPHLPRLIAALDSKQFAERDAATRALRALGSAAEVALRAARQEQRSAEARQRIDALLEELERTPLSAGELRQVRAVRVLERLGSADARRLLAALAAGVPTARQTQNAQAALARLRR